MPKFTDSEKEVIYSKLRSNGELLFVKYGLKKVTVNDIAENAGIGKGTFYHFYDSKEHLFMDIYNLAQKEIYTGVEQILTLDTSGKEKVSQLIKYLIGKYKEHPLISMLTGDLYVLLKCKVPAECMQQNDLDDLKLFQKVIASGVGVKFPPTVVIKVIQSIFMAAYAFTEEEDGPEAIDVMIQAIVNCVVE